MIPIGDKEKIMCEMLGYGLARTCLEGEDNNSAFYKITSILTPKKRDKLLEEVIYFRSYFIDIKLLTNLSEERYKIVRKSFIKTMLDIWKKESVNSFMKKIASYNKQIDEIFPDLMINAEIEPTDIDTEHFNNFTTNFLQWMISDIEYLKQTIENVAEIANTNYENWNKQNQQVIDNIMSENQPTFFKNLKKTWLLIFCVVSLFVCIFFVPYEMMRSKDFWVPAGQSTIFEPPKGATKYTRIIYSELIFREFIILAGCVAGYALSTMIKKK